MTAGGTAPGPSRPRAPLRRLSRAQYNNTVRDLLGDTTRPADQFLGEEARSGFAGSEALAQPPPALVEQYRIAAERLAAAAVKNLATLVPCKPAAGDAAAEEACARAFIDDFGARAFRRPIATGESATLLEVYRKVRAEGDFAFGIQALVTALLQSPHFLYRVELPPGGAAVGSVVALSAYEVASRLSYFFWNTMPDRELFAAAKAGKLALPADIEAQAQRLLRDPRAREATTDFYGHWLDLDELDAVVRDLRTFPDFTEELRRSMREETVRFVGQVTFEGDGKLETLLLSSRSVVNASLGKLYNVAAGRDFAPVDLNPDERAGILTHASLMTITANGESTSPTRRGKFVRDQLMCQPPPPPPPQAEFMLPKRKPGQTSREQFKEHVANAACAACHVLTDPVGFGFENYNAIGKYQTLDAGKPVDASGQVTASRDMDGPFVGAVELSKKLAASAQVRDCFVRKWFEFLHGHGNEPGDEASVLAALRGFTDGGSRLRELMVALTKTEAFRSRLVEAP